MLRQHPAHRRRHRQADEQRQRPDAEQDRRRAVHAADAVAPRGHHTRAAQDSRHSCSHTIHFSDHFVAAPPPCGSSVFELFV